MKVYIAEVEYDHEGFGILGVFSTREAAQHACDEDRKKNKYADGWNVDEFELDAVQSTDVR